MTPPALTFFLNVNSSHLTTNKSRYFVVSKT